MDLNKDRNFSKVKFYGYRNPLSTPKIVPRSSIEVNYKERKNVFRIFPTVEAASWLFNDNDTPANLPSYHIKGETGMDRLRLMFSKSEFGNLSPELNMVSTTVGLSIFIGTFIGGTIASRTALQDILRKSQASVFSDQFVAKRFLQDNLTLALMKGGYKWAWRLALLSGSYSTLIIGAAVYNNKATIWEHLAAGALCGSVWKLKLGLRATAVGGVLGGILGLINGSVCAAVLWLSGTTVEEIRFYHHDYWEKEYLKQVKEKEKEKMDSLDVLSRSHDERIAETKT